MFSPFKNGLIFKNIYTYTCFIQMSISKWRFLKAIMFTEVDLFIINIFHPKKNICVSYFIVNHLLLNLFGRSQRNNRFLIHLSESFIFFNSIDFRTRMQFWKKYNVLPIYLRLELHIGPSEMQTYLVIQFQRTPLYWRASIAFTWMSKLGKTHMFSGLNGSSEMRERQLEKSLFFHLDTVRIIFVKLFSCFNYIFQCSS